MDPTNKGGIVPDGAVSGGGFTQEMVQMQMVEHQVLCGYSAPGLARNLPEVEWVRNTLDGSVLQDHKGYPVSLSRILATKPLRQELSSRPGPGGKRLTYLSGEGVTRTLNDIFGFDGWNLEIVKTSREECVKDDKGRFHVAYTAQVRLTHKKSGTYKEDVGASDSIDRIMGTAIAHALKGSITDALKRAARHFGEKLGNTLYQGDFSISKAPLTLRDALDLYDSERASTKFGTAKKKPQNVSAEGETGRAAPGNNIAATPKPSVAAIANKSSSQAHRKPAPQPSGPPHGQQNRVPTVTHHITNSVAKPHQSSTITMASRNPHIAATNQAALGVSSVTPAAQKFANNHGMRTGPTPAGKSPPLSATDRLSQSNMFGGPAATTNHHNNKENTFQRPGTSSGRRKEPPVVEWSRPQQAGGMKRPLNTGESSADVSAPNKKMNANPYQK